jgi:hypothetical protein
MEWMNQFRIQYIHTQKCHNETLCKDILNKSVFFQKWRTEGNCLGVGTSRRGKDKKKGYRRMTVGVNNMYSCMKMEK